MIRVLVLLLVLAAPAWGVQPDEMLADPALEARAQALDDELRCIRCRSENIASSQADWARDARLLVRDLISEGKSDAEVRAFFIERYGEYVMMRPKMSGTALILWFAGPALLLIGGFVAYRTIRQARQPVASDDLTDEERARLAELTRE